MTSYSARLPQNREQYVQEAAMGARTPHAAAKPPWEGLDPHGQPHGAGLKVHLNAYQWALLKACTRRHLGSQHATALRLLVRAMEAEMGLNGGHNGGK